VVAFILRNLLPDGETIGGVAVTTTLSAQPMHSDGNDRVGYMCPSGLGLIVEV
jgi:hypothetical protein